MSNLNVKNLNSTNATINNFNAFNQENFTVLNSTLSNANITNLTGTNTVMTNITTGSLRGTNAIMTNITTTGLNTTDIIPLNGSESGSLGWIKYYENNFTTASGTFLDITTDGDAHYVYMIEVTGIVTSALLLRLNGVASSSYNSYWQYFGNASGLITFTSGFMLGQTGGSATIHTVCYVSARSGSNKVLTGSCTQNDTGTPVYMGPLGGTYPFTTNITSMSLVMTSNTFTGTVTFYRKR